MVGKRGLLLLVVSLFILITSSLSAHALSSPYYCCEITKDYSESNYYDRAITGTYSSQDFDSCASVAQFMEDNQEPLTGGGLGTYSAVFSVREEAPGMVSTPDGTLMEDVDWDDWGCQLSNPCPYFVANSPREYCTCNDNGNLKTLKKSDGGFCGTEPVQCTEQQIANKQCGDYVMNSADGETDSFKNKGSTFFTGPLGSGTRDEDIGPFYHYVWVYVPQTTNNLRIAGSVDDSGALDVIKLNSPSFIGIENLDLASNMDPPSYATNTGWGAGPRSISLDITTLEKGWYMISFYLSDYGGIESWTHHNDPSNPSNLLSLYQLQGGSYVRKNIVDVFPAINSRGPVSLDGDASQTLCESANFEWNPSVIVTNRKCCGDDASDAGYIAPDGRYCDATISQTWVSLGKNCLVNGILDPSTWFGDTGANILTQSYYNALAQNGADACCGDDSIKELKKYFVDEFNDDLSGWQAGPNSDPLVIDNGFAKLDNLVFTNNDIALKTIDFAEQGTRITLKVNDSSSYPGGRVRIVFMDATNSGFLVPDSDVVLEGCAPFRVIGNNNHLMGLDLVGSSAGVERTCSFTINNANVKKLVLQLFSYSAVGSGSWFDYIKLEKDVQISGGMGDLGYISPDGEFACFDNRIGTQITIQSPGKDYIWRDTSTLGNKKFQIMQAFDNEFIFNGEKWAYCDASGTGTFGQYSIPDLGTFNAEFSGGNKRCSYELPAIIDAVSNNPPRYIKDCDKATYAECVAEFSVRTESVVAFCFNEADPNVNVNYDPFIPFGSDDQGGFDDVCFTQCFVRSGGVTASFDSFEQYLVAHNDFNVCTILGNTIAGCSGYVAEEEDPFCEGIGAFSDECDLLGEIVTTDSCEDIIDAQGWEYSDAERLCNQPQQYCSNGILIDSGDSVNQCCFGANAMCAPFTEAMCDGTQIPGSVLRDPNLGDGICVGRQIGDTDCCIGLWDYGFETFMSVPENEAFICYQQGEDNLIQECCDSSSTNCNNKNNLLNNYGTGTDKRLRTYSFEGVPLHVLYYADTTNKRSSTKLTTTKIFKLGSDFYLSDWSDFEYIEFNVKSNGKNPLEFNVTDSNGNTAKLDFWDYNVTGRATNLVNRIVFSVSDIESLGVDTSDIENFTIGFASYIYNSNVYIDNIFLSSDGTGDNSNTLFCSGEWKDWVSNLDGPDDEGFIDVPDPEDSEIKPYEYTCNKQLSYAWSGNVCCGDDTRAGNKEYFFDDLGLCWEGTLVTQDKTLAQVTGISNDITSSILFYNEDVWLCGKDLNEFNDYKLSYSGTPSTSNVLDSSNAAGVEDFSVMGSWICQASDGWVKVGDTNRVRILATELRELAADDPYTLLCGDYKDVANYIEPVSALSSATGAMCVLKIGDNSADGTLEERTIVGLVIADAEASFSSYAPVLKKFMHLDKTPETPPVDIAIDCSAVPNNPASSEMFTGCTILDNEYDMHIYFNDPFNIVLIGSEPVAGAGINGVGVGAFFRDAWYDFTTFFSNLFGERADYKLSIDFSTNKMLQDFYVFEENDVKIVGSMYSTGTGTNQRSFARVEYHNLHNSVEVLANAMKSQVDPTKTDVNYIPNNYMQIIYFNSTKEDVVDWTIISSMLRVHDVGDPTDFGLPPPPKDGR